MEKIENCCSGDKLQVVFHNERGTVNLSIRVSEINVHKEHLRILALNDINIELDEKEIENKACFNKACFRQACMRS